MTFDRDIIESKIDYHFEDPAILRLAFTHSSYANEHKTASNEKLEFLGDSILNFVIAEHLFRRGGKNEGVLSVMRSQIVSEAPLAESMNALGLIEYLECGVGEQRNNPNKSPAVKADLFEAITGAIYIDSGEVAEAERFILKNLADAISKATGGTARQALKFNIPPHQISNNGELPRLQQPQDRPKNKKESGKGATSPIPKKEKPKEKRKESSKEKTKEEKLSKKQEKIKQPKQKPSKEKKTRNAADAVTTVDYKSKLQVYIQKTKGNKLKYILLAQEGTAHEPIFKVSVQLNGQPAGFGEGSRKKDAEQAAARAACERMNIV